MRPLELTLEGFTSFRNRAEINFDKLEIFAITGQTGAGKSSLLDAMTLALYGQVPRLSGRNQSKELLSQGSLKLQVSLRFLVDNIEYQVLRSWSYRTKTPQAIFKLDKLINNVWQPLGEQKESHITTAIEDILKMNFETFTKVILLPQGQFDQFLKGDASERREILRKLTGFQIFADMRQQAERQASVFEGECKSIQEQLKGLELPSEIELKIQRDRLQFLEQDLPRLQQAVENIKTKLAAEKQLLEKLQGLNSQKLELTQLNKKATEINSLSLQLEQARTCDRLSATWTSVNSARINYRQTEASLKAAIEVLSTKQATFKVQEDNLKQAQIYEAQAQPQLEKREKDLNAAKIYEEQRLVTNKELKRLQQILTGKLKAVAEAQTGLTNADTELQIKRQAVIKFNDELSQYSLGGARLDNLNQTTPLLIEWLKQEKQILGDRTKLTKLDQEVEAVEKEYKTANLNCQNYDVEYLKARTKLETARQENHAATLRLSLHDGDNCPVCGGIYPEAHLLPELQATQLDIEKLEKCFYTVEQQRQAATNAQTQAKTKQNSLIEQQAESKQDLLQKQEELALITQSINLILGTDVWEVKKLQTEHQTLTASNTKYQEILRHKEKAESEVVNSASTLEFAKNKLEDTQKQSQEAEDEVKRQNLELEQVMSKLSELTDNESYENLLQKLEQDKKDLLNRIDQVNKFHQTARDQFMQATQNHQKVKEDFDNAVTNKEKLEVDWQTNLTLENFTEEIFNQAKALLTEQTQWQDKITEHRDNRTKLETLINQTTSEIGEKTTSEEIITQHQIAVNAADEKYKQSQNEGQQLKLAITKAEDTQKLTKELQIKLDKKQQDLQTYSTLSKELQSNRFQAYILQHFERELVEQATVYLRELTEQRYSLKYDDKKYYVEDNWNGGESRKVQTLSGGETFATSLSLALALSERLSRGAKLGSLFIDEGFGTLDAETLQSVSNILQTLGQQDKLVGVITHVPALGEELGAQIQVEKSQEGSRIVVLRASN